MKKLIVRIGIAVVVLLVVAGLAIHFFLGSAIKRGVEIVGPKLTKTPVTLDKASLSLFSGSGKVQGLVVGNPEGFQSPSAIKVGTASLAVQPSSILGSKAVIRLIEVQGPEITLETGLHGNNLKKILANLESSGGGKESPSAPSTKETKPGKKLQVDDFAITGGKIHVGLSVVGHQEATVPLPEIHLRNLGQGPDGITAAELTQTALKAVLEKALEASAGTVADLGKGVSNVSTNLGSAAEAAGKAAKGIGDLFKKGK